MQHKLVSELAAITSDFDSTFTHKNLGNLGLCSRLMTPHRLLDLVMRRSLTYPRLRCLVGGSDLREQDYVTPQQLRRGYSVPMPNMGQIGRYLCDGCTLVLDDLGAYDPTMEVACRALQWELGERVQVNAYLTSGESGGFCLHWDDHDVVVIQIGGAKTWEVRPTSRAYPMFRDADANLTAPNEILWTGTLNTGDVMLIPRGHWHQATRADHGDGYSLHLTFGFTRRTGIDWLTWTADQARKAATFRKDLDAGDLATNMAALIDMVPRFISDHTPVKFLQDHCTESMPERHVRTHSLFGQPGLIVCITSRKPRIIQDGPDVVVRAAGKGITIDGSARPALEILLSGHPVDVDAMRTAFGGETIELIDVLLSEEICAEVTPELRTGYTGLVPEITTPQEVDQLAHALAR
ncbi:JmjC domain-containing protein [Saccharopolyspora shandongensis]|uniref:JmjC domain-containing protein n=1 Tax=Saccharopolyspora shandongensis TaxID=418495 RepID=UPI00340525E1